MALFFLVFEALIGGLSFRPTCAAEWRGRTTPHFHIFYPAELAGKVEEIARQSESDYGIAAEDLGVSATRRIPLYLYHEHRDFRKAAQIRPHDLVVGVTEVKSGRIRLDTSGAFSDPSQALQHEIVHAVLALGMGPEVDELPLWMNEGLAQIVGQPDNIDAEERIRNARGDGTFLRIQDLAAEFPTGESADVAYAAAYSGTSLYVRMFGWNGMRTLLADLKAGKGFTGSFRQATGMELNDFYAAWEDSLVRRGWLAWLRMFSPVAVTFAMIWSMWMAYRNVSRNRRRIMAQEEWAADPGNEPSPLLPHEHLDGDEDQKDRE